ncbi:hypothetical protein [Paraburkholderia caballeronis]|uniref:hypothetical protein n=1 Tax=Paraburkholderia caballeronis TaxID=416943 RepID=UPI001066DEE2|nr:hypothetical protein [Paraburkholderia caballeronis]
MARAARSAFVNSACGHAGSSSAEPASPPVLSMLRRMAEYGESHDARRFFGVECKRQLFILDKPKRLNAQLPRLQVEICVANPDRDCSGFRRTSTDALRAAPAHPDARPDISVFGPPRFVQATAVVAAEAGVPTAHVESERFVAGQNETVAC